MTPRPRAGTSTSKDRGAARLESSSGIANALQPSDDRHTLHAFAELTEDDDLSVAIVKRLDAIAEEIVQLMEQNISTRHSDKSFEHVTDKPSRASYIMGLEGVSETD